jgi:hypothetical protein
MDTLFAASGISATSEGMSNLAELVAAIQKLADRMEPLIGKGDPEELAVSGELDALARTLAQTPALNWQASL